MSNESNDFPQVVVIPNENKNLTFGVNTLEIVNENDKKYYACRSCMTHTVWECTEKLPNINLKLFLKLREIEINHIKKIKDININFYSYFGYSGSSHYDFLADGVKYLQGKDLSNLTEMETELLVVIYNNLPKYYNYAVSLEL